MIRFSHTVSSPLSPREVFDRVADFERLDGWDPAVASSERIASTPIAAGDEFRISAKFLGREVAMTYTLLEWDPPRLARYEGRTRRVTSRDELRCEPAGAGTDLRLTADVSTRGWLRPLEPLLGLAMRIQSRASLRALRGHIAR